jgi:hypothetical protein
MNKFKLWATGYNQVSLWRCQSSYEDCHGQCAMAGVWPNQRPRHRLSTALTVLCAERAPLTQV